MGQTEFFNRMSMKSRSFSEVTTEPNLGNGADPCDRSDPTWSSKNTQRRIQAVNKVRIISSTKHRRCSYFHPDWVLHLRRQSSSRRLPSRRRSEMRLLAVIVVNALLAQMTSADCRSCYYYSDCALAYNGGYGEYCDYFYDGSWNIQWCCCLSVSACAFNGSACICNDPETPTPTPTPMSTPSSTSSSSLTPANSDASQSGTSMGFDAGIGIGIGIGIGVTLVLVAIAFSCYAKLKRQTPLPSAHNSTMSASVSVIMGGARVPVLQGGKVNYINPAKH